MVIVLVALIAIPLTELYVLIQIGGQIGALPTILAVVLTAVIGLALIQRQGLTVVREAQAALQSHEMPVKQMFDGLFLFVAGAMLLTPGFLTDAAGFLLLVPPLRSLIGWRIWQAMQRRGVGVDPSRRRGTIDGEFREVDEDRPAGGNILPPGKDSGRD